MRKVMIGTPSHDGKLDANYVFSLTQTILLAQAHDVEIYPMFVCYDSLVQRARNDLIFYAKQLDANDLIFIDADESWNPYDFFKLLSHDVDVVGGTARKKTDVEQYVVKIFSDIGLKRSENNLIKVQGIGTGFTRLTKKAYNDLWSISEEYKEDSGKISKMIFNVEIENGNLISEDISMCKKLTDLGYNIWFDPSITCDHIGIKNYQGNFLEWEKNLPVI